MPGFVGDHADHLLRIVGPHQQAGVDEYALAAGDKGIETRIVDQDDVNRAGAQAGRLKQGGGIGANCVLDLGVADYVAPLRLGGPGRERGGEHCECRDADRR